MLKHAHPRLRSKQYLLTSGARHGNGAANLVVLYIGLYMDLEDESSVGTRRNR